MFAINQEAFDTFFYWINERESIRQKREAGLPKPWSEDTIFQEWKFCNVFRQYDKQSRWLLENVIMPEHSLPSDDGLLLFNIYAFRAFNWYETYDLLRDVQTGWIQWNENNAKYILSNLVNSGHKLTSGAYMIRGVQGRPKYESIPEVLTRIWEVKDNLASAIGSTDHLSVAYDILLEQRFYGWGPFTTYQVLLDLTYTRLLKDPVDLNTWCIFGPGAQRGLRLIYPNLPMKYALQTAKELWKAQDFKNLREPHVSFLTLQDIEFSLCELFKYMRIKAGGRSKATYDGL